MNETIKNVLEKIESNGFEAYVVGGFVRDHLLGIHTNDVDICTNALPKDIAKMFPESKISDVSYGSVNLIGSKYNFDITTYREELKYSNRRPTEIKYVDNLLTDVKRRDFTINSLCMNKKGEILDLLNATSDIKNGVIRIIGNSDDKLKQDPLRILRALRLAITLKLTIEKVTLKKIKKHAKLVKKLSYNRKLEELNIILNSCNAISGLKLLKSLNILKHLEISFPKNIIYVDSVLGMWSQLTFSPNYPFTKNELNNIKRIREIVSYGKIDYNVLFKYGLYDSLVAGNILGIDKETINLKFNKLPIHTLKDINITSKEIIELLDIKPSVLIKTIYKDLKRAIFNEEIINDKEIIKKYINDYKGKWLNEERSRNNIK